MPSLDPLKNRLRKNVRHWGKWARRRGISCYRLYDRDIPEFPFAIDRYEEWVHVQEYARKGRPAFTDAALGELTEALAEALEVPADRFSFKMRERQRGSAQYRKQQRRGREAVVREGGLRFLVNLDSYLDTGLFLDHRLTRARVQDEAGGKRFLNLFAYTGSFTVYAAAGGARESVTVDLSNTYLDWAARNLQLNGMELKRHRRERSDAFRYLEEAAAAGERFDLIVMDPPSFSNSKRMDGVLDVQRDHPRLIRGCLRLLAPGGVLYFSNNLRRFRLDPAIQEAAGIEEITAETVPDDFKRRRPHRCWCIVA